MRSNSPDSQKNSHRTPSAGVVKITTLEKFRQFLIFLLPATLFLAAYPQIHLGSTSSMNFEISIPEIWLILFSVASLSNLPKLWQKHRKLFLWTAIFPLYTTLSLFWTTNLTRGFLTAGLLWLVWFSIWNIILTLKTADKIYHEKLRTVFLATSAIFAGICWLQCLLDVFGAPRETSLLCEGCISAAFGFPHPNGLTLEPQFMGNLLLAPAILSLSLYFSSARKTRNLPEASVSLSFSPTAHPHVYLALFAFFSATLFLTFSRGAIYAFAVVFIISLAIEMARARKTEQGKHFKFGYSLLTIPIIILSFIFALTAQGIFAELGPTNTNFISAITSSIHQLSLGKIDFRPKNLQTSEENISPSASGSSAEPTSVPASDDSSTKLAVTSSPRSSSPTFSGYVTESTDVRVSLTEKALDIWNDSPKNIILGSGLGSAGEELYKKFPDDLGTPKEIVQNEYASLLLELGLLGCLCLVVSLFPFLKKLTTLELSYALTLFFFSGLPNALHIYLFPSLIRTKPSKPLISPKSP